MSDLGPIGVGLSVAFAVFVAVVAWEVYYIWRKLQRKARDAELGSGITQIAGATVTVAQEEEEAVRWTRPLPVGWLLRALKQAQQMTAIRKKQQFWWSKLRRLVSDPASLIKQQEMKGSEAASKQRHDSSAGTGDNDGFDLGKENGLNSGDGCGEEDDDDDDIFKIGGLWGPPRLLFTIAEETKEEMEMAEEARSRSAGVKGSSRRGSRASNELVLLPSTPYETPPSSPPFATPFGSPSPAHLLILKPSSSSIFAISDLDASSTSISCSSSSTSSSASPLPNRFPLASLFEDSSASATPSPLSPPPGFSSSPSSKRLRHNQCPLGLLLDPPPSPSSALYGYHSTTRVYPLLSPPPVPSFYHRHIDIIDNNNDHHHHLTAAPAPPLAANSCSPPRPFRLPALSTPSIPSPFRHSANVFARPPPVKLVVP